MTTISPARTCCRRHLGLDAAAHDRGHRRGQIHQRTDRVRSAGARAHFQPVAQQDEHQQHGCGFVEHLTLVEKSGAHAEDVTRADREHDQGRHVGNLVTRGPPCGDHEGPDRIGDGACRDDEEKELAVHPEGRGKVAEHLTHRGVQENGNGEHQGDQEAVAHVLRHVLHRHAGRVAHVMHHVGLLIGRRTACCVMGAVARVAILRRCRWRLCAQLELGALAVCASMHCVASMVSVDSSSHLVLCRIAYVGGNEFAAAVVAAIDNALPNSLEGDLRFVVVHGRAAGHVVHVGVMHAGQRRQLAMDTRCTQGGDQLADFDGACFHRGSLTSVTQCANRLESMQSGVNSNAMSGSDWTSLFFLPA